MLFENTGLEKPKTTWAPTAHYQDHGFSQSLYIVVEADPIHSRFGHFSPFL